MATTLKKPLALQKAKIRTPSAWMMLKKPAPRLPDQLDPGERAWQTDKDPGK